LAGSRVALIVASRLRWLKLTLPGRCGAVRRRASANRVRFRSVLARAGAAAAAPALSLAASDAAV